MLNFPSNSQKLSGAAEARRAHNPEDTGSKPVSASKFFYCFMYMYLTDALLSLSYLTLDTLHGFHLSQMGRMALVGKRRLMQISCRFSVLNAF